MSRQAFSTFDLTPGNVIAGRFRIEGPSRQAGLAAAFRAQDEQGGGPCELVVLPASLFDEARQAEEFRRALEPWLEVRTRHVARVRELVVLGGETLMEVCDLPQGRPLREWLQEHRVMASGPAVRLGMDLLQGALAIHERGLVHGDIKPQTIFVEPEGQGPDLHGVLVDGGVTAGLWSAKHLGDRTALIGTPFYAPVEQFGGEAPDVQSDVYNVATVLFELLTGVLPWPGKSLLEVFQAKLERQPPRMASRAPTSDVDPALERVIGRGLMAERDERYSSAAAFLAALEPFSAA